jgi:hypothetical protein
MGRFTDIILPPMPFPVWEAAVMHTITVSSAFGVDLGCHNPLLLITRARNVVVTD